MTDWKDDLANLLADVATSTPGQAVGGILGSAPVQGAFTVLNAPLSAVQYGTGALIGGINEGLGFLPGKPGYEAATSRALHHGDIAGAPRRVWDQVRSEEPLWFQAPTEVLMDPTTYTGLGLAGRGAKTLRGAQEAAVAAGALDRAQTLGRLARPYEVAQAINDAPGKLVAPLQRGVAKAVSPLRNATGTGLLDLSPKSKLKQEMDQVYNALADARASGVMQPLSPQQAGLPGFQFGQQSLFPATPPSQRFPLTNTAFFEHPGLTREQNTLLATPLSDGRTYGQFLDEHSLTAATDTAKLQADGVTWDPDTSRLDDWLKAVKGTPNEAENEKIVRSWHKQGIDLLHADSPDDIAAHLLEGQLKKERGIRESGRSYLGSLLKSAWGEQALFSGRYHTGNIQSNVLMSLAHGNLAWSQVNPATYIRNFKIFNAGTNKMERERLIAGLKSQQLAMKYGEERIPVNVFGGGIQDFVSSPYESAIGTIAGKVTGSERVARVVGKPFVWNNRIALGVDLVPRDAIFSDVKERVMSEWLKDWESAVRQAKPGLDFATFGHPNSPTSLAAGPLKSHLESIGINAGDAERLTRDYIELRGRANTEALREMHQVQFDYLKTNLDEQVSKFVPFHYWYSRALRFWGEAALRNPYLMTNYMRANRGLEDAQADPGLNARQKGFLRLMGTPLGFSLMMNPDALFGVVKVFGMEQANDPNVDPNSPWNKPPEGMTDLGGVMDWMKNRGVGLYPWMDGLLNMMGAYGNTFEPDLLGIRHRALVGSAVNWAMSQAGAHPPGTPYANAMGQARWALSSTASQFLPGWLAQPVAPKAGGSTQQASLETIIEHTILTDNPGLSGEQLLEIMSDPDSPEYEAAYQKAASAGAVQQLLNFTLPMSVAMRNDARDVRMAQKQVIEDAATKAGVTPFQFAPTIGDVQFAADYKRLTGSDWKPGDYADASFKIDLARAPEGSKRFIFEDAAYKELGTDTQKQAWDTYNALKYGTAPGTAGLPQESRDQLANAWLDRTGNAGNIRAIYDQRDAFALRHPDYAAYLNWKDQMQTIQGMYGNLAEYRRQASAQNPNAARYFTERQAFLQRTEPDPERYQEKLEQATMSPSAFLAITGQGEYRSQPGGIPGAPQFDTALPGMLPPAQPQEPYNPQENWMAQLARYGQSQGIYTPWR